MAVCVAVVFLTGCGRADEKSATSSETATVACPRTKAASALAWTDTQPLQTGGRLTFRTWAATVVGQDYVVEASVTNRSEGSVGVRLYSAEERPEYMISPESFGIAYREAANPGNIASRKLINFRATAFVPPLPEGLEPGETWRGRFCGRSRHIPDHHEWYVIYGYFIPGGYWVTDKTFRTR